ncbi:hypothetical protein SBA2_260053 [Acidobacteriia bacterium SbA2]|nr:hypothetical protein SBA2_260053 [Acidobacteriia bacterium SbA2]
MAQTQVLQSAVGERNIDGQGSIFRLGGHDFGDSPRKPGPCWRRVPYAQQQKRRAMQVLVRAYDNSLNIFAFEFRHGNTPYS